MSLSVGSIREIVPRIVPSVTTDRIEKSFLSRQTSVIEYLCTVRWETTPCSGRRDNSFMPRRPYAGVAPAQPGLTPVASTSTSAGAALGLHHLRMVKA